MNLSTFIQHAVRWLSAMYANSPLLASVPWYAQPENFGALSASLSPAAR